MFGRRRPSCSTGNIAGSGVWKRTSHRSGCPDPGATRGPAGPHVKRFDITGRPPPLDGVCWVLWSSHGHGTDRAARPVWAGWIQASGQKFVEAAGKNRGIERKHALDITHPSPMADVPQAVDPSFPAHIPPGLRQRGETRTSSVWRAVPADPPLAGLKDARGRTNPIRPSWSTTSLERAASSHRLRRHGEPPGERTLPSGRELVVRRNIDK